MIAPTAVIADDEPLLVAALQQALQDTWPTLDVVATAQNGIEAIECITEHQPDIAFLDIQMPGATGMDVAHAVVEDWPGGTDTPPPLWVFVTAYDNYAVDAFEAAAVDYVLKPVKPDRLQQAIERLQTRLGERSTDNNEQLNQQLRQLIDNEMRRQHTPAETPMLRTINASVGDLVRVIPIDDVILFESADKYVSVITAQGEAVIREPLKNILPQLDPAQFARIHRSVIVNLTRIEAAVRDDAGNLSLQLRDSERQPPVSRLYRYLFQAM